MEKGIKLLWLGLLFAVIISCSCNKTSDTQFENAAKVTAPQNVVKVRMVGHWLGEGKRERLIREFVNEYEFLNQNVAVNVTFPEELYHGELGEQQFIIDQITKPVADYDILRLKSHYPAVARLMRNENWGSKYLVDFYHIPGFLDAHIASLNMETIRTRTGGICVSPCFEGNYEVIYVNLHVAEKIGITVKQFGMTYADLVEYLKAAQAYNQANKTNIIPMFENDDSGWLTTEAVFVRLFYSLLDGYSEISNPVFSEKKIRALEQTFELYEELAKYKPIRPNSDRLKIDWGRDNDYPLKDSCLFFVNGAYMYNIWDGKDHQALSKMMPCELPVVRECDTYMGDFSSNWCIPLNAPNKEEAVKLMMYWCSPAMAEKWARYTKCPSGIKGNLTDSSFGGDAFENFQSAINKKYGSRMVAVKDQRLILGENNNIPLQSTLVLGGVITAKEAMRNINRNLKRY